MRSRLPILFLFVCLQVLPLLARSQTAVDTTLPPLPSAEFLLSQLTVSSRKQSYRGVFSFEQGGKIETFGGEHLVYEGREYERLIRTTGSPQGYVRQGELACGTIGGKLLKGLQLTSNKGKVFGLNHYYRVALSGEDRVAGREAWVIHLVPTDSYRYGMALTIDKKSLLLSRYVVFDAQKNIALERMQFASLTVLSEPDTLPELDVTGMTVVDKQCASDTLSLSSSSPWRPTWLPPGFLRVAHEYSAHFGHMESYTDGLSSFSIFINDMLDENGIESANASSEGATEALVVQGVSARGATTAMLSLVPRPQGPLSISIVGEIPARVAQRITLSVTRVQSHTKAVAP